MVVMYVLILHYASHVEIQIISLMEMELAYAILDGMKIRQLLKHVLNVTSLVQSVKIQMEIVRFVLITTPTLQVLHAHVTMDFMMILLLQVHKHASCVTLHVSYAKKLMVLWRVRNVLLLPPQ